MKKCKFCNEKIQDSAKKCRFCGEWVEDKNEKTEKKSSKVKKESLIKKEKVDVISNEAFDFGIYFNAFLKFLFSYKGRINRLEYIFGNVLAFFLFMVIVMVGMLFMGKDVEGAKMTIYIITSVIGVFAFYYSMIILSIKRFHDIDKSGWFMLIPIYNFIANIFFEGDKKENRFGEDLKNNEKLVNIKTILIVDGMGVGIFILFTLFDVFNKM